MSSDIKKSFLTYYIQSLKERTRVEKSSVKTGIDWPIYGIALAYGLSPIRLPFFRQTGDQFPKSKSEAEFGIDEAFLSENKKELTIFVLKDEALTNRNWTDAGFERDLRMALTPDLTPLTLKEVSEVIIILAYNQDEDANGLKCYSNFVNSSPTKVGDKVKLRHDRWNLDRLSVEVENKLMNPNLLPERYFSLFSYICSQYGDFRHGSDQWDLQLVPNWKRFLKEVFRDLSAEKAILLLPVTLMILRESGSSNVTSRTGYIDLVEWAILQAWSGAKQSGDPLALKAAEHLYSGFYLTSLEAFYSDFSNDLTAEHAVDVAGFGGGGRAEQIAASMRGLWHSARVGLLAYGYFELLAKKSQQEIQIREKLIRDLATLMIRLLNASPSFSRPLLDIHYIELFLIWRTLIQVGKRRDIGAWLSQLERELFVRRIERDGLFFVHGGCSLEPVWEYAATGKKPPEFCDGSSCLILMLMILSFALPEDERDSLLARFQTEIVLAQTKEGKVIREKRPLHLMAWHPPADWEPRILSEPIAEEGECMVLELFTHAASEDGRPIATQIEAFAVEVQKRRISSLPQALPKSLVMLACIKHQTPMPVEMWLESFPWSENAG